MRPPILPRTDSRSLRVFVARGSIEYSAVTQPSPEPCFQRGTPCVKDAEHSTRVPPNVTRHEPSAACLEAALERDGAKLVKGAAVRANDCHGSEPTGADAAPQTS